jgi:hypothetical protein
MSRSFSLRAIISAVDRLSPVLRQQQRNIGAWQRQFGKVGKGAIPMAVGLAGAMSLPAKAFMDVESSTKNLQNTLMTKDGLMAGFKEISAIAVELGNKLPGTVADFNNMAVAMHSAGMKAGVIVNGGLKAAAYLGLVTKDIGGGYDQAADSMARLGVAFKIADSDMVGFADTIARTINLGAGFDDVNYAMARVSGSLAGMGLQGAGVAKSILPVIAMLNQIGIKGESAGTGLGELFRVVAPKHPKSIEAIINGLVKLKKQHPQQLIETFTKIFGKEHGMKLLPLADPGAYANMVKRFEEMASLEQKVANTLGGLAAILDAASGTFQSAMAIFGAAYAPEIKATADAFNRLSASMGEWFSSYGSTIKIVLETVAAFTGYKLAALGVAFGLGLVKTAFNVLVSGTILGRILLLGQLVAALAPTVYENWGKITGFLKDTFGSSIDWIMNKWDSLKGILLSVSNLFGSSNGMTLPGGQSPAQIQRDYDVRKRMAQSSAPNRAVLEINHNNAPKEFRAVPVQSRGPWAVNQNVGYRSLGFAN